MLPFFRLSVHNFTRILTEPLLRQNDASRRDTSTSAQYELHKSVYNDAVRIVTSIIVSRALLSVCPDKRRAGCFVPFWCYVLCCVVLRASMRTRVPAQKSDVKQTARFYYRPCPIAQAQFEPIG